MVSRRDRYWAVQRFMLYFHSSHRSCVMLVSENLRGPWKVRSLTFFFVCMTFDKIWDYFFFPTSETPKKILILSMLALPTHVLPILSMRSEHCDIICRSGLETSRENLFKQLSSVDEYIHWHRTSLKLSKLASNNQADNKDLWWHAKADLAKSITYLLLLSRRQC